MKTICDTHVLLFWAHEPGRLTTVALRALENNVEEGTLACADITWWEIALLHERGRIRLPPDVTLEHYMRGLMMALRLDVLPITPDIAAFSISELFSHKDPADRLIVATAIIHRAPLITADERLRSLPRLQTIW